MTLQKRFLNFTAALCATSIFLIKFHLAFTFSTFRERMRMDKFAGPRGGASTELEYFVVSQCFKGTDII